MIEIPSCILSQNLWYNESIWVDKASSNFLQFLKKWQWFHWKWYEFVERTKPTWKLLLSTDTINISERHKFTIKENHEIDTDFTIHEYQLINAQEFITSNKLASSEIYSTLISEVKNKSSSNIYFKYLFTDYNID